jgi:hypothetical protein
MAQLGCVFLGRDKNFLIKKRGFWFKSKKKFGELVKDLCKAGDCKKKEKR